MKQKIWLRLFDARDNDDGELEFTVDCTIDVDHIPRIGEKIHYRDVAYEVKYVVHDYNDMRVVVTGFELADEVVRSCPDKDKRIRED